MMNYKFVKDEDGRNYLLPQHLWSTWDQLIALGEGGEEDERWANIESCRIDGVGEWCFMSPVKVQSLKPDTLRRVRGRVERNHVPIEEKENPPEINPDASDS